MIGGPQSKYLRAVGAMATAVALSVTLFAPMAEASGRDVYQIIDLEPRPTTTAAPPSTSPPATTSTTSAPTATTTTTAAPTTTTTEPRTAVATPGVDSAAPPPGQVIPQGQATPIEGSTSPEPEQEGGRPLLVTIGLILIGIALLVLAWRAYQTRFSAERLYS